MTDEKLRQDILDRLLADNDFPNNWQSHAVITYGLWITGKCHGSVVSSNSYKAFEAAVLGQLTVLCSEGKVAVKHAGPNPGSILVFRAVRILEALSEIAE